jgi:hypothetical protein
VINAGVVVDDIPELADGLTVTDLSSRRAPAIELSELVTTQ